MVKCWDLETNKVIRHYHGHLSGVYALDIHPTLDVLVTSGRDATARVSSLDSLSFSLCVCLRLLHQQHVTDLDHCNFFKGSSS